jgi:hypothetical protein
MFRRKDERAGHGNKRFSTGDRNRAKIDCFEQRELVVVLVKYNNMQLGWRLKEETDVGSKSSSGEYRFD